MLDTMDGVWVHEPLKCKEWRGEHARYLQPKRDGWHIAGFMQEDPTNGLCMFGRKREAHLEYSHVFEGTWWYTALAAKLPSRSSVEGELWVPGKPASYVRSAMACSPQELRYTVFAVPYWRGEEVTSMEQARHLTQAVLGLEFVETLLYEGWPRERLLAGAVWWDAEGVVLKAGHREGWYKLKRTRTVDLVVTAVKPARLDSKFIGDAGSLHGGVWRGRELVEVACCSGMDDATRNEISSKDVGRVFEAEYQYLGAGERLRHPRFLRWRDDKPAPECTWDQLEA